MPPPTRRLIRVALWASVALNALGVAVFLPPSLGRPSPLLPIDVPPFFAAQVGFTILLFDVVYAWLAMRATVDRGLVTVGGVGKLGFFAICVLYAMAGEIPATMAVNATPDLALGAVFLWWARGER